MWGPKQEKVRKPARESGKAMSLALILLDFQHAGVRRSLNVVHETKCRHAAVQRGKQDQNHCTDTLSLGLISKD